MYTEHFGLSEPPFKIIPDPRFLWYSDQHKEAKAKIEYHLEHKDGPVYLSAEVGLGKTSIARRLRDELVNDKSKQVAYAFAPNLKTANQFMRFIADEFNVKTARSYAQTLRNFETFLLEQFEAGVSPVLLVDEAQNLPRDTLKTIHHLFNFATYNEFLIQVALFGQPELHKRIQRFRSLSSRMYMAKLDSFDLDQTREMMQFRWTVAGGGELPFDQEAIEEIYRLTSGIARDICKLANETLLRTVIENHQTVTKTLVLRAVSDAFEEVK
ncbi:MAG: AAA family ATPase [Anaerolineales bacterium]|nr:AAA family ATPase [Anaerolineales bacterium]